jgi:hypothetical protein
MTTEPDTKIPRAILPENPEFNLINVMRLLKRGEYGSDKHYVAIVKIPQLETYILFYRKLGGNWSLKNIKCLAKTKNESLDMLDNDVKIHSLIHSVTDILPVTKHLSKRKTRRRSRSKK